MTCWAAHACVGVSQRHDQRSLCAPPAGCSSRWLSVSRRSKAALGAFPAGAHVPKRRPAQPGGRVL